MNEIMQLQKRIQDLEGQVKNLQEAVGRWRRKAQGADPHYGYISERHERGQHFISISVEGLPADSPLHEAQEFIRNVIIPKFHPYRYWNCYTSKRYDEWVVTLVKEDHTVDMDAQPAPTAKNVLGGQGK